jgi:tousled-like kinase
MATGWNRGQSSFESPTSQTGQSRDYSAHPSTPTGRRAASGGIDLLDPQKRELLEARFLGKFVQPSNDSNLSTASVGSVEEGETVPKKRKIVDGESRRINDFFPRTSSTTISSQPRTSSPVRGGAGTREKDTQTVLHMRDVQELERYVDSRGEQERLQLMVSELQQQLNHVQSEKEKLQDRVDKSCNVIKSLLLEKAVRENTEARAKCMKNRLHLGQFVTQRQGAQYVENWQDGTAFTELHKNQEALSFQRDELEKERKLLTKKKPGVGKGALVPRQVALDTSSDNLSKSSHVNSLTPEEHHAREEILKLRAAALKKVSGSTPACCLLSSHNIYTPCLPCTLFMCVFKSSSSGLVF